MKWIKIILLAILFVLVTPKAQDASLLLLLAGSDSSSSGGGEDGSMFSLANITYDSISFDVAPQNAGRSSIRLSSLGTKLWMVGNSGAASVYEYDLTTPFSLVGASYSSDYLDVDSYESTPRGVIMTDDGTKLYIVGRNGDRIFQWNLSTPFSIATATYYGASGFHGLSTNANCIEFNADGSKIFIENSITDVILEADLSTPYDITTAGSFTQVFDLGDIASTDTRHFSFLNEGKTVVFRDVTNAVLRQLDLSVAYDWSTAVLSSETYDHTVLADFPLPVFSTGGGKFFWLEFYGDIYQFSY